MRIWQVKTWFVTGLGVMLFATHCHDPTDRSFDEVETSDPRTSSIPDSVTNHAFAELIRNLSEPGGRFHSSNFTSNESSYLHPLIVLRERQVTGGVYVGVGPEQNYTYIAEIRPEMAFVVDIRRQNMLLHLIYKALFSLSNDRVEFLSGLLSKPLNSDLSYLDKSLQDKPAWRQSERESSVVDMIAYFDETESDIGLFKRNLVEIKSLLKTYGIVSIEDMETVERVYQSFFERQLDIQYDLLGELGESLYNFPNLRELILAETTDGDRANFLAKRSAFDTVKEMHRRNLIIPVVGDFAGESALIEISDYVRSHNSTISVFYVSNVEYYLAVDTYRELQESNESSGIDLSQHFNNLSSNEAHLPNGFTRSTFARYFDNVSSMPIDESSLFIRSYANDSFVNMMSHPRRIGDHPFTSFVQSVSNFTEDGSWRTLKGYDDYIRLVSDGIIGNVALSFDDSLVIIPPRMTVVSYRSQEYSHLNGEETVVSVRFDSKGIVDSIWTETPSVHPALDSLAQNHFIKSRLKPKMGTQLVVPNNMIFNYRYRLISSDDNFN